MSGIQKPYLLYLVNRFCRTMIPYKLDHSTMRHMCVHFTEEQISKLSAKCKDVNMTCTYNPDVEEVDEAYCSHTQQLYNDIRCILQNNMMTSLNNLVQLFTSDGVYMSSENDKAKYLNRLYSIKTKLELFVIQVIIPECFYKDNDDVRTSYMNILSKQKQYYDIQDGVNDCSYNWATSIYPELLSNLQNQLIDSSSCNLALRLLGGIIKDWVECIEGDCYTVDSLDADTADYDVVGLNRVVQRNNKEVVGGVIPAIVATAIGAFSSLVATLGPVVTSFLKRYGPEIISQVKNTATKLLKSKKFSDSVSNVLNVVSRKGAKIAPKFLIKLSEILSKLPPDLLDRLQSGEIPKVLEIVNILTKISTDKSFVTLLQSDNAKEALLQLVNTGGNVASSDDLDIAIEIFIQFLKNKKSSTKNKELIKLLQLIETDGSDDVSSIEEMLKNIKSSKKNDATTNGCITAGVVSNNTVNSHETNDNKLTICLLKVFNVFYNYSTHPYTMYAVQHDTLTEYITHLKSLHILNDSSSLHHLHPDYYRYLYTINNYVNSLRLLHDDCKCVDQSQLLQHLLSICDVLCILFGDIGGIVNDYTHSNSILDYFKSSHSYRMCDIDSARWLNVTGLQQLLVKCLSAIEVSTVEVSTVEVSTVEVSNANDGGVPNLKQIKSVDKNGESSTLLEVLNRVEYVLTIRNLNIDKLCVMCALELLWLIRHQISTHHIYAKSVVYEQFNILKVVLKHIVFKDAYIVDRSCNLNLSECCTQLSDKLTCMLNVTDHPTAIKDRRSRDCCKVIIDMLQCISTVVCSDDKSSDYVKYYKQYCNYKVFLFKQCNSVCYNISPTPDILLTQIHKCVRLLESKNVYTTFGDDGLPRVVEQSVVSDENINDPDFNAVKHSYFIRGTVSACNYIDNNLNGLNHFGLFTDPRTTDPRKADKRNVDSHNADDLKPENTITSFYDFSTTYHAMINTLSSTLRGRISDNAVTQLLSATHKLFECNNELVILYNMWYLSKTDDKLTHRLCALLKSMRDITFGLYMLGVRNDMDVVYIMCDGYVPFHEFQTGVDNIRILLELINNINVDVCKETVSMHNFYDKHLPSPYKPDEVTIHNVDLVNSCFDNNRCNVILSDLCIVISEMYNIFSQNVKMCCENIKHMLNNFSLFINELRIVCNDIVNNEPRIINDKYVKHVYDKLHQIHYTIICCINELLCVHTNVYEVSKVLNSSTTQILYLLSDHVFMSEEVLNSVMNKSRVACNACNQLTIQMLVTYTMCIVIDFDGDGIGCGGIGDVGGVGGVGGVNDTSLVTLNNGSGDTDVEFNADSYFKDIFNFSHHCMRGFIKTPKTVDQMRNQLVVESLLSCEGVKCSKDALNVLKNKLGVNTSKECTLVYHIYNLEELQDLDTTCSEKSSKHKFIADTNYNMRRLYSKVVDTAPLIKFYSLITGL